MEILLQDWAASWWRLHSPEASQTSKIFFFCVLITYNYPAKILEQIFSMVLQEQWDPDPEFIAFKNKLRVKGRKKGGKTGYQQELLFLKVGFAGGRLFFNLFVFYKYIFWIQRSSLSWISVPMKTFGVGSNVDYFQ